jgi:hypothetical protein
MAIGWLAVKTAAVNAFVKRNPIAAATFSSNDPRVPISLALAQFRQNGGVIDPALSRAAIESLKRAPLMEEPFMLAALSALVRKDGRKAELLLEEARARNPRSRLTHILLLDRYLRTGRLAEATTEIGAVSTFVPDANKVLVPQLAKFAVDPSTRKALDSALDKHPALRGQLLEHLATSGTDLNLILALAPAGRGGAAPGEVAFWQQLLINSLIEKNDLARAEQLWTRFGGVALPNTGVGIYDGQFRRLPGPPPFNWSFTSNPAGTAEPTKTGLDIQYYGRAPAELASQLLRLAPGRYQLNFHAFGQTPERGSALSWRMTCYPGNAELAAIPVAKLTFSPKAVSGRFSVPSSGCPAQWLKLVGTPAEFPTSHSVTISDIQVRKAGGP